LGIRGEKRGKKERDDLLKGSLKLQAVNLKAGQDGRWRENLKEPGFAVGGPGENCQIVGARYLGKKPGRAGGHPCGLERRS